jgi:16S rRNA (guanine966-N2)-methyltransferase
MATVGSGLQDARVLDLFAGSGALGLEALSRGARSVVFVERARPALAVLRSNIELLGAQDECRVVARDAVSFARALGPGEFDLVLADPPYDRGWAGELLLLFEERGFARELWVEHRSSETVPNLTGLKHRRYGDTTLSTLTKDP